jgi:acetoin utilization protein AcuB
MEVRAVMQPVVMTVRANHSCFEAAVRMRRSNVHHLPVLNDDGELQGVITDRDLRSFLFGTLADTEPDGAVNVETVLRDRLVRDVMSAPAITVSPEVPLAVAVRLMAKRKIGSIPVLEDKRLVGIVTETDLIRLLFRRRLFCCPDVESVLLPVA